jgi:hypothetical protein
LNLQNLLALIVGFFGGGFVHWYAMRLLATTTGLDSYSWNVPAEGDVLRSVLLGDFAIGALLTAVGGLLIIWRRFNVGNSLLFGFGASIVASQIIGVVLCVMGC